jgi:hypothetical protein
MVGQRPELVGNFDASGKKGGGGMAVTDTHSSRILDLMFIPI